MFSETDGEVKKINDETREVGRELAWWRNENKVKATEKVLANMEL